MLKVRNGLLITTVLGINEVEVGCISWSLRLWPAFHKGPFPKKATAAWQHFFSLDTASCMGLVLCFLPQISPGPLEMKGAWFQGPNSVSIMQCPHHVVCEWGCTLKPNSSIPTLLSYSSNLECSYLVLHEPSLCPADSLPFSSVVWYRTWYIVCAWST